VTAEQLEDYIWEQVNHRVFVQLRDQILNPTTKLICLQVTGRLWHSVFIQLADDRWDVFILHVTDQALEDYSDRGA
jgi:hypothetical protein